jgi:hypothetical protein
VSSFLSSVNSSLLIGNAVLIVLYIILVYIMHVHIHADVFVSIFMNTSVFFFFLISNKLVLLKA